MKRKGRPNIPVVLLALLLLVFFVSCEDKGATTSMRITLDSGDDSRSIVPEGLPLDVVKYQIDGKGPDGASFSLVTTRHQTTLDGLPIGEWTVTAKGQNSESVSLTEGTTTCMLTQNQRNCVIHVDRFIGSGTLSVTLKWKDQILVEPRVVMILTSQKGGSPVTEEPRFTGSSLTWTKGSLESGSYLLQAQLYSGRHLIAGLTEAVRIADGRTSSKTLTFDMDDFPYAPGSLVLYDSTGAPINCVIEGLSAEVESGKPVMLSLKPENPTSGDLYCKWYVDGVLVGDGGACSFSPEPGLHRLDALAYTDKIGTYGSASVSFEAVVKTDVGIPGNNKIYSAEDGLKIGRNTVLSYADNSLLVLSGENRSLQVAELVRNQIDIVSEAGADSIAELANAPAAVGVTPHPIATDGTYGLILLTKDKVTTAKLNFDVLSRTVTRVEGTEANEIDMTKGKVTILEWRQNKAEWDAADNTFMMLDKADNRVKEPKITYDLLTRKLTGKAPEKRFAWTAYDIDYRFNQLYPGENFSEASVYAVRKDGNLTIIGAPDGRFVKSKTIYSAYAPTKDKFRKTAIEASKYQNPVDAEFHTGKFCYILGANWIGVYDSEADREQAYLSEPSCSFRAMELNPVTDHLYALSGRKLITWKIGEDGFLTGRTETNLGGDYDDMTLSQDGRTITLWNRANTVAIEMLKIKTK